MSGRTTTDDFGTKPLRKPAAPIRESDIKKYLFRRVKEEGGEVRKIRWEGRNGAPDTVVMLPGYARQNFAKLPSTTWAELKAPGGAAIFPKNAHERAQHREHERMRKMGQQVVVIDSYEQIEELLK